jgi:hypothetical protein
MNGAASPVLMTTEFAHDADSGDYVLTLVDTVSQRKLVSIQVPAAMVEAVLRESAGVALEVRSNGMVAAFADRGNSYDLAVKPIGQLIAEMLEVLSVDEDSDDLAKLETALEAALSSVRRERGRLTPPSGP